MNKKQKYFLNSAIVVLLMVLVRFIPPFGAMTPLGMTILGIFVGALYGWITCDMIWPSVLALIMLGFTGYNENIKGVAGVLTATISAPTTQTILWLLVFSAMLSVTGISKWAVTKLVSSKLCKGHPWRLSVLICLAVWLCASFGAGFAAILICWQFVYTICAQVGYTKEDKWPRMMVCAIIFFNALGALVLPFQAGVVANYGFLAKAFGENGGYVPYDYTQYFALAMTISACVTILYFVIMKLVVRPDVSKLMGNIDVGQADKLDTRQKLALGALVALFVVSMVPSLLPNGSAAKAFMNNLGNTACILGLIALATFLRDKEGKPFFTFKELANAGIMWPLIFMVSTATTLGGALSAGNSGFTATITSVFGPVLEGASPYVCAALIAVATLCLTNLINNTVASAIMIPVMFPFANKLGINPYMLTALVTFCANCGLLLPCASPAGALLHGNKEWITTRDAVSFSLLGMLALILVAVLIGIPMGNLLFA